MSSDQQLFESFSQELEKAAAGAHMLLGNVGALAGTGAVLGAGAGGVLGGVRAYRRARAEGAGVGQGLAHGVGGVVHGAGRGALAGAAGGALVGAATPHALHEGLAQTKGPIGAGARFGQRQVHALTGWLPNAADPKSLETIRGGAYSARKNLGKSEEALAAVRAAGGNDRTLRSAQGTVGRARQALEGAEGAQREGLTNIPGYAKAFRAHPLDTVRAGVAEQWRSGGVGAKALMVGMPAMSALGTIRAKESPTGAGKGERLGRDLAATAGNVLTAPLPFVPGQLVSSAMGGAGGLIGRGVDRLRGRRADAVQPAPNGVSG